MLCFGYFRVGIIIESLIVIIVFPTLRGKIMLTTLEGFLDGLASIQVQDDPMLCQEVSQRYRTLQSEVTSLPPALRYFANELIDNLLPSDWPLWMEMAAVQSHAHH